MLSKLGKLQSLVSMRSVVTDLTKRWLFVRDWIIFSVDSIYVDLCSARGGAVNEDQRPRARATIPTTINFCPKIK